MWNPLWVGEGRLHFLRRDIASNLPLSRIVAQDSLHHDLGLSLGEELKANEAHWLCDTPGEEQQEDEAHGYGEEALDLLKSVRGLWSVVGELAMNSHCHPPVDR